MSEARVLIDNTKGLIVRLVGSEKTDVLRFPDDILFTEQEVELFRSAPVEFTQEFAA